MGSTGLACANGEIVSVTVRKGAVPVVVVCEHASAHIPARFDNLGLAPELLLSHIAWDPYAQEIATQLADLLEATCVESRVSRLVYDCNRPPEAPDAMPAVSEIFSVPGNEGISSTERDARVAEFYRPFEAALEQAIADMPGSPVLVTIHTFTPVYKGERRDVEIGILHDADHRLADAMLAVASQHTSHVVRRNEPYGPEHGVTHTLKRHGMENGLLNVMIEVRNDLAHSSRQWSSIASDLADWIRDALAVLGLPESGETREVARA